MSWIGTPTAVNHRHHVPEFNWGFPKIKGILLGGPYTEDCSMLGSILGSPSLGNYPFSMSQENTLPHLFTTIAAEASKEQPRHERFLPMPSSC